MEFNSTSFEFSTTEDGDESPPSWAYGFVLLGIFICTWAPMIALPMIIDFLHTTIRLYFLCIIYRWYNCI